MLLQVFVYARTVASRLLFSWNFDTYVSIFYVMRLKWKKYEILLVRNVSVYLQIDIL